MNLIVLGINHKTAPVALREQVAFTPDSLVRGLASLCQLDAVDEAVILSTCNRTEVYVAGIEPCANKIGGWLAEFHQVDHHTLLENSYLKADVEAVQHLMHVACGLDSLVMGEPQILGQVKQAFADAKNNQTVGRIVERLFQQTFSIAKKVRTETEIGANAVSVAFAAVQLAKHIFSSLDNTQVLLIGAGETIELVARHLSEQNVKQITVANRTLARAEALAEPLAANVLTLAQIPHHLHEADIVISSTASQLPVLGKGLVESALKRRKHKPIFFVDLAVPRDIESEVSELADAYLYTVDDLQGIVKENLASRQHAARQASGMIDTQAQLFQQWSHSLGSIDVLKEFRAQGEAVRQRLLERALSQLSDGKNAEQVLTELANKLTKGLLHAPTKALKEAAHKQDSETLLVLKKAMGVGTDESAK